MAYLRETQGSIRGIVGEMVKDGRAIIAKLDRGEEWSSHWRSVEIPDSQGTRVWPARTPPSPIKVGYRRDLKMALKSGTLGTSPDLNRRFERGLGSNLANLGFENLQMARSAIFFEVFKPPGLKIPQRLPKSMRVGTIRDFEGRKSGI